MTGRPSKYDIKFCDISQRFMGEGYSKEALAGKLGISRDTLYQWCKTYPEFSDAIKKGESASLYFWEKILHDSAIGKKPQANPTALIFIMKTRFHWRDKPPFEDQLDKFISQMSEPEDTENENDVLDSKRIREILNRHAPVLRIVAKIKDENDKKKFLASNSTATLD
ncbi:MAG: hypothetical protein KBC00_02375 [Candidatus Levybacteria bacterium]|nr:hypothetical protein [Candidatus Levybacteria bacterium]MBP9815419.1 hypothetical protein [Candidatus Levybacteria bacterium]